MSFGSRSLHTPLNSYLTSPCQRHWHKTSPSLNQFPDKLIPQDFTDTWVILLIKFHGRGRSSGKYTCICLKIGRGRETFSSKITEVSVKSCGKLSNRVEHYFAGRTTTLWQINSNSFALSLILWSEVLSRFIRNISSCQKRRCGIEKLPPPPPPPSKSWC